MRGQQETERVNTIVIGGGQAGLSVGYHLARRGVPFLILDAGERIGDAWRKRWDSLRLFTPSRLASLDGMRIPVRHGAFATKDEVADYLEAYAARFRLPVRTGVRVDGLSRTGNRFVVTAGDRRWEADAVVVAMSNFQQPRVPAFALELDADIVQMHSTDYRNPGQLRDGPVLVVGVGNSGADIGLEVSRSHRTWLAGRESGEVPFRIESAVARHVLFRFVKFVGHHVLSVRTPIGRRARPKLLRTAGPLVRVRSGDLAAAGVERVPRVVAVRDGRPLLADGRALDVANVIWCTGFEPGFSWIRLAALDEDGMPAHRAGIVEAVPRLFFVGLHFLYAMSSATLIGVGRDAKRIAGAVADRARAARAA
jgi:putative flavoprotein involved in K+ transport